MTQQTALCGNNASCATSALCAKAVPCICSLGADDNMACACARSLPGYDERDYLSASELDTTDYSMTRNEKIGYAIATLVIVVAIVLFAVFGH